MATQRTEKCRAGFCWLACVLGICLIAAPGGAQTPIFPAVTWNVQPAFAADARNNIGGANCTGGASAACLAVSDATSFAQAFSIAGTTLRPGPIIPLTGDRTDNLARPAEGATHDRGFFYIVTSRAKSFPGIQADTGLLIIRLSIEGIGRPQVPGALQGPEVSEKIRQALNAGIPIPQFAGEQLTRTNSDIEGIAVKDGVMHLGFRAPVLSGKAFIVSVPVQAVFGSDPLNPTVHTVALGPNVGILDLATVSDGVLILAGPTRELAGPSSLFHFNDNTGQLKPVAELVEPVDRKGEGLLVLEENLEFYRVLVLYDGVADGGPIQYSAPR